MTWHQGGQEIILRQVEPKVFTPEHLNTAAVIKETLITSAVVWLSLLSKREEGSRIATEGRTKGIFVCATVCLKLKMLQVKRQGCHCLSHALKTTWSEIKKIQRARSLEGILSPLNGLGFVSSGIKELITEAVFFKWQPCPVRTSLLWYDSTHSDGTQPSANHCSSFQLWPSYNYTLKASVDLNELSSNQLSLFWIKSTRLSVCLITRIALWEMN